MLALITLHEGPAAFTEYIVPVTSEHVTPIAAPVIGLVPILPLIADLGTSVIPDLDRITKLPATPRSTTAKGGLLGRSALSADILEFISAGDIMESILFWHPPINTTNNVAMAGNNNCFECMILNLIVNNFNR
jgi:hypothetical protein